MTKIKGSQILNNSTEFDIFKTDENGKIQLPENVQFNGDDIVTQTHLTTLTILLKIEKISKNDDGDYLISSEPAGDVQVSINGVIQTPGDDYSIDGQKIVFQTEPNEDDIIVAKYLLTNLN
jgi:hypothetical protein